MLLARNSTVTGFRMDYHSSWGNHTPGTGPHAGISQPKHRYKTYHSKVSRMAGDPGSSLAHRTPKFTVFSEGTTVGDTSNQALPPRLKR